MSKTSTPNTSGQAPKALRRTPTQHMAHAVLDGLRFSYDELPARMQLRQLIDSESVDDALLSEYCDAVLLHVESMDDAWKMAAGTFPEIGEEMPDPLDSSKMSKDELEAWLETCDEEKERLDGITCQMESERDDLCDQMAEVERRLEPLGDTTEWVEGFLDEIADELESRFGVTDA